MRHLQPIPLGNHGRYGGDRPWYRQHRPPVLPWNALNNNSWKGFYFILTKTLSLSTINIQSWKCSKIILDQRVLSPPMILTNLVTQIASVNVEGQGLYFEPLVELIGQELTNTAAATGAMYGRLWWLICHRHLELLVFVVVVCRIPTYLGRYLPTC